MKAKTNKNMFIVLLAAIASLVGVIVYVITSTSGYLGASDYNIAPVILTAVAIVLLLAVAFMNSLPELVHDLLLWAALVMILVSIYLFVMARVQLAADVYFIPVNYPESEASALHTSIVGGVFYIIAVLAMIGAGFTKKAE